ncbi:SRPBCC family protein [Streptomyces sp. NPDC051569]|uniref:SRPBCC family protein n=1 Tax=Streptomyces sp. NPDC051569 TaxID=3365661 RepID=UPI003795092A
MAQVEATTERTIAADAETVFDALADYEHTRAKLLPEQFSEYEIREGGDGEGTLVHWKLQATSKRVRDCLLEVTEPSDGRLVEKDRNSSMVTTWTVTPAGEGRSKAVVTTVWDGAGGIGGFFERTFAPKGLGRIYDLVLDKLAAETESRAVPEAQSDADAKPATDE